MKSFLAVYIAGFLMSSASTVFGADLGSCSPEKMGNAPVGSTCRAKGIFCDRVECTEQSWTWEVGKNSFGRRIYREMLGMKVTEVFGTPHDHTQALRHCGTDGEFRLPTGYLPSLNGQLGFPDRNSDFQRLVDAGFEQVVPGAQDHMLWSSSVNYLNWIPTFPGSYPFFAYNGALGGMDGFYPSDYNGSDAAVVCVSGR